MASFLDELKQFVRFSDADSDQLVALLPIVEPRLGPIMEVFYDRINEDADARAVITGGDEQIERLKQTLAEWLRSGLAGPQDEAWFELRSRIGRRHVKIGLPQRYMLTAMNVLRNEVHRLIEAEMDASDAPAASAAVDRLFDMELAIMLETYKHDSERRLRAGERLVTIGQLAATIGHDLRNPMGVIQSSTFILRRRLGEDERSAKHLDRIERQLTVAGGIIEDLLHFVREAPLRPEKVRVRALLEAASMEWDETATISIECDEGLETALDQGLVRRGLVNLLTNAQQAMRGETEGIGLSAVRDGGQVKFEVRDRGPGFPTDTLRVAFEPLHTTRATGTGLGLALVQRVAERHGGVASAANRPEGGAVVTISLPSGPE